MRSSMNRILVCVAWLGITSAAAAPLPMQSTTMSGVTVKATPLVVAGERWEFEIVLETHSGDLGDDLVKSAILTTDEETSRPLEWRGDPPGGHHRKGVLTFRVVNPGAARVGLTIVRPGETEPRAFRWQLR